MHCAKLVHRPSFKLLSVLEACFFVMREFSGCFIVHDFQMKFGEDLDIVQCL
ncbi:hypothetical protein DsansV1_C02g0016161 [Dioscorea sansibarensis]